MAIDNLYKRMYRLSTVWLDSLTIAGVKALFRNQYPSVLNYPALPYVPESEKMDMTV